MADTRVSVVVETKGEEKLKRLGTSAKSAEKAVAGLGGKLKDSRGSFAAAGNAAAGAASKIAASGRAANTASAGFAKLAGAVRGLVSAYALVSAGKFIFGKTAELQTQTRSIQTLTGSLGEAQRIISELQKFANVTPFTSSEIIDTSKRLIAFGVSAERVVDVTKRLGDIAGASGANIKELALAYGQVVSKGRLQTEELLQFQERGVGIQAELQRMYGKSGEEIQDALSKGQISAEALEVAIENLTSAGGKYADGAISQSTTLNGRLSTLQDTVDRVARALGKLLTPAAETWLKETSARVEKLAKFAEDLGLAFAFAADKLSPLLTGLERMGFILKNLTPPGWVMQLINGSGNLASGLVGAAAGAQRDRFKSDYISPFAGSRDRAFRAARGIGEQTSAVPALRGGTGGKGGAGGSARKADKKLVSLTGLAMAAGFSPADARVMAAIALAESGGNPRAYNPNAATGDNSYGLWQINMLGAMGPERRRSFGISRNEQLFDPATNARAARQIYGSQGFGAWSVYKSGAYKRFLGQDRTVGEVSSDDITDAAVDAYREQEESRRKSVEDGEKIIQQLTRGNELLNAGTEFARRELEVKHEYEDTMADINQLQDASQKLKATELADAQKATKELQIQKEMLEDLYNRAAEAPVFSIPEQQLTDLQKYVQELEASFKDVDGQIISASQTLETEFASAMGSAVNTLVTGTGSVKEAFSQMFSNIGQSFVQMATKMLAQRAIFGLLGGLGGLFGGGGAAPSPFGVSPVGGGLFGGGALGTLGFSGGGYTGDDPRSGGVDGEGGFPAILHPQETVIDHSNLRSGMNGNRGGGTSLSMSFQTTKFMDREWVDREQLESAMAQAAKDGGKRGEERAIARLQRSPQTRSRLGLR